MYLAQPSKSCSFIIEKSTVCEGNGTTGHDERSTTIRSAESVPVEQRALLLGQVERKERVLQRLLDRQTTATVSAAQGGRPTH